MKLRDFVKGYPEELEKQQKLDSLIGVFNDISKSSSNKGTMYSIGVDDLVNNWVRQQLAYREKLLEDLINLSRTVSEIAAPVMHIKNEVFRKGIEWNPKFAKKCNKCGREYENIVEKCDCGSEDLREPDENQLDVFKRFADDCNIFDESLADVLKQFEETVNVVDDAYIYIAKEYRMDGDTLRSKPIEIRHLRASAMEFDLDGNGIPKNSHWLCPIHRDIPVKPEPGECSECGMELMPAMYKYKHRNQTLYFLDSEICHESKFHPSTTYGFPPLLTVFEKALTLVGMDKTLYRYFFERKMPASMLMVATDDVQSIRRARADIVAQMKQDPDYIPMVGYSPKQGSRGRVDFVRLFHTLQEMDYLPVRDEIRSRIAAIWGLPPMWQSEYTGFGGLSGQTQQMVQFSRVVESDQGMFNEKVLPFISSAFGITDWDITLKQPEEKAESTRIQFAQQRVSVANMLKQMGFKVEVKEGVESLDDIDFKVSGEMEEQQQMMPPGMGGGEESPFGMSKEDVNWTQQILDKGYTVDSVSDIRSMDNGASAIVFNSADKQYVALFQPTGKLVDVWNAQLHQHTGYPSHDKNMPHNTMARRNKKEEPFEEDDDDDNE